MIVKFGYPKYMPSPYSVYVSQFSEEALELLKKSKPFARYDKEDKEYEISPEVYARLKKAGEPCLEMNSLPSQSFYSPLVCTNNYPFEYQDQTVEFARSRDNVLINFSQGMGKALVTGTIVKTPKGDKPIELIQVGDYVFGDDGEPTRVSGVYFHHDLPAYEFLFEGGITISCLNNHIWTFRNEKGEFFDVTVEDLITNFSITEVTKLSLPLIKPVKYPKVVSSVSCTPSELYAAGKTLAAYYLPLRSNGDLVYAFKDPLVSKTMSKTAFKAAKQVFDTYLYSCKAHRQELLKGLLHFAGYSISPSIYSFSTLVDKEFLRSFLELVRSLAFVDDVKPFSQNLYFVSCRSSRQFLESAPLPDTVPVDVSRHLLQVHYIGNRDGVCLSIENSSHLYLTEGYVPTHNTRTTLRILEEKGCKKILVIVGVSNLQEEWMKDALKHHARNGQPYVEYFNMRIVGGDPQCPVPTRIKYLQQAHKDEDKFLDLLGLESLRSVPLTDAINLLQYDAIVVDEVQAAKGMNAEQTEGLHDIKHTDGQVRLALSGTPALNDPLEYYSVLRFLQVLYYKSSVDQCSRTAFNNYYGEWGFDFWEHRICTGYKNLSELRQLLAPILAYAPKSLLRLPIKYRQLVELPVLNPRYEDLVKLYKKGSNAVKKAGYKTIQALASELQVMTSTDESKFNFVCEHIKAGERPLVFSMYTTVLDYFKDRLTEKGVSVRAYDGRLSSKQRLAVLSDWTSGNGDVLLLQIATARYGLNLQQTQVAIFLEPPTSPAILEQAEDRLHRIGQTKEVYSYVLIAGKKDQSGVDILNKKAASLDF